MIGLTGKCDCAFRKNRELFKDYSAIQAWGRKWSSDKLASKGICLVFVLFKSLIK